MHLRVSRKQQGDRTYQYAQLVESFRRSDGLPSHRVVANLGALSEFEIENLRIALQASREGRALVRPSSTADEWKSRVIANLQYLDVAVALEAWRRWKLPGLFNRLLPRGLEAVAPSAVIAALTIQRCVDPGSKLYAQRWFPRSALAELLGVEIERFNNTRIHRVLASLDEIEEQLQEELPKRYEQRDGAFTAIFMDVTDAWFHGRGPKMAHRSRTKEGLTNRRKVGIVLACNEHGYPLRWRTVPGKRRDSTCMEDMLEYIQDQPWARAAPLVCDRSMGRGTSISKILEAQIPFLTATFRSDTPSFTDAIPYEAFLALSPIGASHTLEGEIQVAAEVAAQAGFERIDHRKYCLDLGVRERILHFERPRLDYSGAAWDPNELEGGASFIALARIFQERLDEKRHRNRSELAKSEGLTRARVTQILNTLRLDEELQERVLLGHFGYVPERLLRECVKLESEEAQRRLLEQHAQRVRPLRRTRIARPPRRVGRHTVRLRMVAYFNPQMFVDHRVALERKRRHVERFVARLNREVGVPGCKRQKEHLRIEVSNELARWKLLNIYDFTVHSHTHKGTGAPYLSINLKANEEAWQRRIRYAGIVLLVGSADLPHTAAELVELYRQKDTVEKDFQTIKQVVKLRPFYHHTDPKVRAHVTLCMLALLLERTIEQRLKRTHLTTVRSAAACFEELRSCSLNVVRSDPGLDPTYVITEPTQEQQAVVRSLRMKDLIDPEIISENAMRRV